MICLIFMGLLQISHLFAAREILHHAAARAARARTVGFNQFMVNKAARVAAIPVAGKMLEPAFVNEDMTLRNMIATLKPGALWSAALEAQPVSAQYNLERARIPEYLASENGARALHILDYSNWDSIAVSDSTTILDPVIHINARLDYPLWAPMHRTFYAADTVELTGESYLENHYPLYIDEGVFD